MINRINQWAKAVKSRDNFICRECGSNKRLHAHHIKPRSTNPELALDVDNGITLCQMCHADRHVDEPGAKALVLSDKNPKPLLGAHWADAAVHENTATGAHLLALRQDKKVSLPHFAWQLGISKDELLSYESNPETLIPRVVAMAATAVKHRLSPIPDTCRLSNMTRPDQQYIFV